MEEALNVEASFPRMGNPADSVPVCPLCPWLPDGDSQILRSHVFGRSGLKYYGWQLRYLATLPLPINRRCRRRLQAAIELPRRPVRP